MSTHANTLYPPGGFGAPKHRRGQRRKHLRLLGEVTVGRRRRGRAPGRRPDRQRQRQTIPGPVMKLDTTATSGPWIPDSPDLARMYSEVGARLRSAMADHGVDAMILLMNGHVSYATGASWPLLDAGLSHAQRPVAIMVAGDEHPHLFMPFREGASAEFQVPADHRHGPLYLEFDEGVEHLATTMAEARPAGATVAVDEMTGAMRDASDRLFPGGPPLEAAVVVGAAQLVKTPDEISCIHRACRITEQTMAEVQKQLAPGVSQLDLSATFVRRAFELGATANMLDAIWQVMPRSRAEGQWTTHGDLALPLLTTDRRLCAGDGAVDRR